jgi:hypothetical protein
MLTAARILVQIEFSVRTRPVATKILYQRRVCRQVTYMRDIYKEAQATPPRISELISIAPPAPQQRGAPGDGISLARISLTRWSDELFMCQERQNTMQPRLDQRTASSTPIQAPGISDHGSWPSHNRVPVKNIRGSVNKAGDPAFQVEVRIGFRLEGDPAD